MLSITAKPMDDSELAEDLLIERAIAKINEVGRFDWACFDIDIDDENGLVVLTKRNLKNNMWVPDETMCIAVEVNFNGR